MEDNLNGRRPQWKTPQWKMTSMEDDLNGRQTQWRTTLRKPYRKQMTSACLASRSCTKLGPAQPQLVLLSSQEIYLCSQKFEASPVVLHIITFHSSKYCLRYKTHCHYFPLLVCQSLKKNILSPLGGK